MPRTARVSRRAILNPERLRNFFRCTPFSILLRVYQIPPQKTTGSKTERPNGTRMNAEHLNWNIGILE